LIDHTGIGVSNVSVCAKFYDAVLGALGMARVAEVPRNQATDGIGYGFEHPLFWIDRFHPHSARQHVAFAAKSTAEVDAFHKAGLSSGGTDNGAPGFRTPAYDAAFVVDPDGNNMEAVHRGG
jgi:catechol 2,3-dioxygenase-like lactoylglutathione lyase family enzyme